MFVYFNALHLSVIHISLKCSEKFTVRHMKKKFVYLYGQICFMLQMLTAYCNALYTKLEINFISTRYKRN